MERNGYHLRQFGLLLCAAVCYPLQGICQQAKRPNFVWFMTEDVCIHYLSLYNADGTGAQTPNVKRLAREGVVFNHAFCNAPVSSAARSTLFTGFYAPRVGLSWHRKLAPVTLPLGTQLFPAYLKEAGYYTVNSAKTDYNCVMPEGTWDNAGAKRGEWQNRPDKDSPFFYVQTCTISHESCLHFSQRKKDSLKTRYNPDEVKVAPWHPDTELFRYTYATFYDRIDDADAELGKLIDNLSEKNVLDDTFIFYFGDNGGALPGSKGYTGEQGLHVPLVVYIPKNWRNQVTLPAGSRADGFVSFLDFGPTLLHLAGIDVPRHMDGKPFLGKDISKNDLEQRDITCGYGDRYDELYAFNRTLRKGNFKYSRNFTPYQPKGFYNNYRYNMPAFKEWKTLYEAGKLTAAQKRFFEPQEPEELYDLSIDPHEMNNLANNPQYAAKLRELRGILKKRLTDRNDLGLIPESEWVEEAAKDLVAYGNKMHKQIAEYSNIIDLELLPFAEAKPLLKKALASSDAIENFWAATVCISFGKQAEALKEDVKPLLVHASPIVRSRAGVFLSSVKQAEPASLMPDILYSAKSEAESLLILGDMVYLQDYICGPVFNLSKDKLKYMKEPYHRRINYLTDKK
jgi:arylsulfatase A-like enzyme